MQADLDISELPMPEGFGDAAAEADGGGGGASKGQTPKAAAKQPVIANLDFINEKATRLDLQFPFRRGKSVVDHLILRHLTIGDVAALSNLATSEAGLDYLEIYAAIARTDASEIRGLKAPDGERLADMCQDFLPRAFQRGLQSG